MGPPLGLPQTGPDGPKPKGAGTRAGHHSSSLPRIAVLREGAGDAERQGGSHWRSVIIPMIMPRPDTIPLTGGYRAARRCCRWAAPTSTVTPPQSPPGWTSKGTGPTLYPAASRLGLPRPWPGGWTPICLLGGRDHPLPAPEHGRLHWPTRRRPPRSPLTAHAFSQGATIRQIPARGGPCPATRRSWPIWKPSSPTAAPTLFGPDWSIADFSTYHVLWFVHAGTPMAGMLARHPAAQAWFGPHAGVRRQQGRGHDRPPRTPAGRRRTRPPAPGAAPEPATFPTSPSAPWWTSVPPTTASMPSRGELVHCDTASIIISRDHERTGLVNVHFPRHGFGATRV